MSKKNLIIICISIWIALILSILVPEIVFRVKRDEYIEVQGMIVDTYMLGGNNRVSPPRYYIEVEYKNSEGTKSILRGIKRALNEEVGDTILFYLDANNKPKRVGVLTTNTVYFIRITAMFNIAIIIMYSYRKSKYSKT